MQQGDYYIRLLDRSGKIVDLAGFQPEGLPITSTQGTWQTLKDADSNRYQQISLTLHTKDNQPWGYMQMGRSVKDIDDYLANVRLILWLGLPSAMILVGGSALVVIWVSNATDLPIL